MCDIDYTDTDGAMFDLIRGNIYPNELVKRIRHTPKRNGIWHGERGMSYFEITDTDILNKLKPYGCCGIHYNEYIVYHK